MKRTNSAGLYKQYKKLDKSRIYSYSFLHVCVVSILGINEHLSNHSNSRITYAAVNSCNIEADKLHAHNDKPTYHPTDILVCIFLSASLSCPYVYA